MNKNSFNFRRFWQLLCQHFVDNRRTIGYVWGGTLLACVTVILFTMLFGSVSPWMEKIPYKVDKNVLLASEGKSYAGWIVTAVMYIFVSYVFINMSKRSDEIRYLMLPATNAEKWLSRVVYVLVVGAVVLMMYNLSIPICAGIGRLLHIEILIALPQLFDYSTNPEFLEIPPTLQWIFWWTSLASMVFLLSAFLLGGTVFRQVPWLSTTAIVFSTFLAVTFPLAVGFGKYVTESRPDLSDLIKKQSENNDFSWIYNKLEIYLPYVNVGLFVLGIVFLWLSYRLFCRRQLAHKKIKFIR